MIEIRLCFDDNHINHLEGSAAQEFMSDIMKNNPRFLFRMADEVTMVGPWGKVTERRE